MQINLEGGGIWRNLNAFRCSGSRYRLCRIGLTMAARDISLDVRYSWVGARTPELHGKEEWESSGSRKGRMDPSSSSFMDEMGCGSVSWGREGEKISGELMEGEWCQDYKAFRQDGRYIPEASDHACAGYTVDILGFHCLPCICQIVLTKHTNRIPKQPTSDKSH